MNLNYESNDKIASEGFFSAPRLLAISPPPLFFWLSLTFTLVLYFSFDPSVVLFHFFLFLDTGPPSPFLFWLQRIQLLAYSIRAREKLRGKERKKVSNDDNTQFDKTDEGLN